MFIKASLHIHTKEDHSDGHAITYNIYELIDHAEKLGFNCLALTGHRKFLYKPEYGQYAEKKGITLIPGIELALKFMYRQNHVLVLNCDRSVEEVKSFAELQRYKKENPHIFIIAPHPASTSGLLGSIGTRRLKKFIDIFDAIEYCWLYTARVNQNRKAEKIALAHSKPFISTADIHTLRYFNTDYLMVDTEENCPSAIFSAIRQGKYINCTRPKRLTTITRSLITFYFKYVIKFPLKIYRLQSTKE